MQWLIAHGARINGWQGQRFWPLGQLNSRSDIDLETYRAMLETLLAAGADPDTRLDNDVTLLMEAGPINGEILLAHGASVHVRDAHGQTPMHYAYACKPEKVRLLLQHGANINALAQPEMRRGHTFAHTPLQNALYHMQYEKEGEKKERLFAVIETLLELGADPKIHDGDGRSTLCYCLTPESFKRILACGLDPFERQPDGGTLLHNLARMRPVRADSPDEVAFFDYLLSLGLDINAADRAGQTMLHIAAQRFYQAENIALLLKRGARKNSRDNQGHRPFDRIRR
jgi:ankyrin repeat protein